MFSGLMSRWTMPCSWAYCSASQIFGTIASAWPRPSAGLQQLAQIQAVHEFHQQVMEDRRRACL